MASNPADHKENMKDYFVNLCDIHGGLCGKKVLTTKSSMFSTKWHKRKAIESLNFLANKKLRIIWNWFNFNCK
jgi:hypothetical protein